MRNPESDANETTPPARRMDERLCEELGRLNNELIALQLQLARRNDQLQRAQESLARHGLRCRGQHLPADEHLEDDPPADTNAAGTQRALALIRRIVQLRGGRFWQECGGPNKDIRFCFTLGTSSPEPGP